MHRFFRGKRRQIHCEKGHSTVKSFTWNSFGSRDYFFRAPKTNVVGWWMVFFLVNKTNWMWPCLMSTVVCWLHTTNISWHRLSFACIATSLCLMRFEYTKKCMEKVSNQAEWIDIRDYYLEIHTKLNFILMLSKVSRSFSFGALFNEPPHQVPVCHHFINELR